MNELFIFPVVETGDGSPTLKGEQEPMHHLGGAYTETQYIYGDALRLLVQWPSISPWSVVVVGLGLGYIELLAMAESIKNNKKLRLLSYEVKEELVHEFLLWLRSEKMNPVYDLMLTYFEKDYGIQNLKKSLIQAYEIGTWEIRGALNKDSLPSQPNYNAVLFDAFSGKATPDLWTEDFLELFLVSTLETTSLFSTYACTGVLKRVLQKVGFKIEKRPGFFGKRHCTLAQRERPNNPL